MKVLLLQVLTLLSGIVAVATDDSCSNFELDVAFVQDLSGSMLVDLLNIKLVQIPSFVYWVTTNHPETRFAITSFTDKPIEPFGSAEVSVTQLRPDYCYKEELQFTNDVIPLLTTYSGLVSLGGGGDDEDNQVGALVDTITSPTIGWRKDNADVVKLLTLLTDAPPHVHSPGDNLQGLTLNDGVFDANQCTTEFYPSISQLEDALADLGSAYIVFLVTDPALVPVYQNINSALGQSEYFVRYIDPFDIVTRPFYYALVDVLRVLEEDKCIPPPTTTTTLEPVTTTTTTLETLTTTTTLEPMGAFNGSQVMILLDNSDSFKYDREAATGFLLKLKQEHDQQNFANGVEYALGSFVDKPVEPFGRETDYCFRLDVPFTRDFSQIQNRVASMNAYSGGDLPESSLDALVNSLMSPQVTWNHQLDIYRQVVLLTDATSHEAGDATQLTPYTGVALPNCTTNDYVSVSQTAIGLNIKSIQKLDIVLGYQTTAADITAYWNTVAGEINSLSVADVVVRSLAEGRNRNLRGNSCTDSSCSQE